MTKKELYKRMIKSQSGVLYLRGKPGLAKSALMKEIAQDEKWDYVDVRLAQRDSSEVIGLPYKDVDENGTPVMRYAYPKYLVDACKRPTLIVFDELNRAVLETRNAALQILNERQIGDLKLNENVYMVALGNLGEEDGCEVEEFDNALNNRLIHKEHDLTFNEWVEGYAKKHVNPYIIQFIEANLSFFYKAPAAGDEKVGDYTGAYPTPRSWTFLSDLLGKDKTPREFLELVKVAGGSYVGACITRFVRYCEDTMKLSIKDVIERYNDIKKDLKKVNRDKKSELLGELKKLNIKKYSKEKIENINSFLNLIDADERVAYLNELLESIEIDDIRKNKNLQIILKNYQGEYDEIESMTMNSGNNS